MVKNIYPCPSLTFRLAHIRVLWECGEGVANNIFASKNYLQHFKHNTCYKEGVANNHFHLNRAGLNNNNSKMGYEKTQLTQLASVG